MFERKLSVASGAATLVAVACAGEPKNLPLLQLHNARNVQPSRAAAYTILDGRIVLTSDWVELDRPAQRGWLVGAFDAIELDLTGGVLGPPTDQSNPPGPEGCLAAGPFGPSYRWYFGAAYSNPFCSADLTPARAAEGVFCNAVGFAWYVDVGDAEPDIDGDGFPDSPLYIAIHQFESMDVVGCTDDGTNPIDGVIYDFTGVVWRPDYYNYTGIDLGGTGLGHTMPAGPGGYQIIYGIAFDAESGQLIIPQPIDADQRGVNVQPMLWGTGGNEFGALDDGRGGVDVDGQFDDFAKTDGVHDFASECRSYLYGVCPDPLAAATGFYYRSDSPPACPCIGDIDGDGVVGLQDLTRLLSLFGQPCTCSNPCLDPNDDDVVDFHELALLLTNFGSPCP